MATAMLVESPPWTAAPPTRQRRHRLAPPVRRTAHPTPALPPLEIAAPAGTSMRPTRFLALLFCLLGAVTVALYGHTVQVEGEANRERIAIRKLKESNHFLQLKLAQATNLGRVETEATRSLNMQPVDGGLFMALPDEVVEMASTVILPGREPSPVLVLPGI